MSDSKKYLYRVIKFINRLCIVYFSFSMLIIIFILLSEGFNSIEFSFKKALIVYGIPFFIFGLTKIFMNKFPIWR